MGFNKNAKVIPLVVLVLGLVAAVGMYLHQRTIVAQRSEAVSATAQVPASISPTALPSSSYFPSVPLGTDTSSVWLAALNTVYQGQFVNAWNGYTSIEWPMTESRKQELEASGAVHIASLRDWEGQSTLFTGILGSAPLIENGITKEYVLMQTQTNPRFTGHPSTALLGGAVLEAKGGQWQVDYLQTFITEGGTFGTFPYAPTVINIGKNHPAFLLRDTATYQGNTYGNITLYTFANGVFRNVLHADYEDNQQAFDGSKPNEKPIVHVESMFEPLQSAKEFYDIRVTTTVTTFSTKGFQLDRADNYIFKIKGVTSVTTVYVFDGQEYVKKESS
jgi:hypothetical protein